MGEAIIEGKDGPARGLIRVAEPFHAATYYCREMLDLTDQGYKGWWHAYFGYRPAPMGAVSAGTVTGAFYNFAPRMVERAVPGVWAIRSPEETVALRRSRVGQALDRVFGSEAASTEVVEAAEAIRPVGECAPAGRPVFGGYAELEWPTAPIEALWHGCTLLREHRGDSHNLALAAAEIDGVECHVLMAGRGHGNRPTITAIRGWTDEEWHAAVDRLRSRQLAGADGSLTDKGHRLRSEIETHTDRLTGETVRRIGSENVERLIGLLRPLADRLAQSGEVSGRWPPEHLLKPDDNTG